MNFMLVWIFEQLSKYTLCLKDCNENGELHTVDFTQVKREKAVPSLTFKPHYCQCFWFRTAKHLPTANVDFRGVLNYVSYLHKWNYMFAIICISVVLWASDIARGGCVAWSFPVHEEQNTTIFW